MIKEILKRVLKNKVPVNATHFFVEGGYITFLGYRKVYKPKKLTKKEYLELKNSQLAPFKYWSLK